MSFVVLYDANVLYPSTLRDLLIRLAQAGLVQAKWTEEVRSRLRHETSLRSQDHLLAEPELNPEEEREVILNRLAPSSVDVDGGDRVASREDVIGQTDRESIDGFNLGGVLRRNDGLDVPPVALHELELRSSCV